MCNDIDNIARPIVYGRQDPSDPKSVVIASLQETLCYRADDIIDRYLVDFGGDEAKARELFEDCKRWLWLCAEARREHINEIPDVPMPTIFDGQTDLDNMWHTFILFTMQYIEFCTKYFGTYLHHEPTPERVKREFYDKSPEERREGLRKSLAEERAMAGYVFDKLGPEVARRWYLRPYTEEELAASA